MFCRCICNTPNRWLDFLYYVRLLRFWEYLLQRTHHPVVISLVPLSLLDCTPHTKRVRSWDMWCVCFRFKWQSQGVCCLFRQTGQCSQPGMSGVSVQWYISRWCKFFVLFVNLNSKHRSRAFGICCVQCPHMSSHEDSFSNEFYFCCSVVFCIVFHQRAAVFTIKFTVYRKGTQAEIIFIV